LITLRMRRRMSSTLGMKFAVGLWRSAVGLLSYFCCWRSRMFLSGEVADSQS
jgi:hypothetical protein